MKKKIMTMLALMSASMLLLSGCGEDNTEKESAVETSTPAEKKEEKQTHPGEGALENLQNALDEYLEENPDGAYDIQKDYIEDSLEGKVSDDVLEDIKDILD